MMRVFVFCLLSCIALFTHVVSESNSSVNLSVSEDGELVVDSTLVVNTVNTQYISYLKTDGAGRSDLAEKLDAILAAANNSDVLMNEIGDLKATVANLAQTVSDLEVISTTINENTILTLGECSTPVAEPATFQNLSTVAGGWAQFMAFELVQAIGGNYGYYEVEGNDGWLNTFSVEDEGLDVGLSNVQWIRVVNAISNLERTSHKMDNSYSVALDGTLGLTVSHGCHKGSGWESWKLFSDAAVCGSCYWASCTTASPGPGWFCLSTATPSVLISLSWSNYGNTQQDAKDIQIEGSDVSCSASTEILKSGSDYHSSPTHFTHWEIPNNRGNFHDHHRFNILNTVGPHTNCIVKDVQFFGYHDELAANKDIVSEAILALSTPDTAYVVLALRDIDGGMMDAAAGDLVIYASRDDGTSWTQLEIGEMAINKDRMFYATGDLSSQTVDSNMRYKIEMRTNFYYILGIYFDWE